MLRQAAATAVRTAARHPSHNRPPTSLITRAVASRVASPATIATHTCASPTSSSAIAVSSLSASSSSSSSLSASSSSSTTASPASISSCWLHRGISTTASWRHQYHHLDHELSQRGEPVRPDYQATTILCVRRGDQVVMIGDGQTSMGNRVFKPNAIKVHRIGKDKNVLMGFAGSATDCLIVKMKLEERLLQHPGEGQLKRACVEQAKHFRTERGPKYNCSILVADATTSLSMTGRGDLFHAHDGVLAIGSGSEYAAATARGLMSRALRIVDDDDSPLHRRTPERVTTSTEHEKATDVSVRVATMSTPPSADLAAADDQQEPEWDHAAVASDVKTRPLSAMLIARTAMQIAADSCVYTNHNFQCEQMESTARGF